jgi:hypothetical protein
VRMKELDVSNERITQEQETPRSAEVGKNVEPDRPQTPAEAEQKQRDVEYDEVLDDRFQATDN